MKKKGNLFFVTLKILTIALYILDKCSITSNININARIVYVIGYKRILYKYRLSSSLILTEVF